MVVNSVIVAAGSTRGEQHYSSYDYDDYYDDD